MSALLEGIASLLDLSTILICSVVFATIVWFARRPSNLPPGPFAWPWLGSIPGILVEYYRAGSPAPHKFLALLGRKYDELYSFKLGSLLLVVANDLETVQEAGRNQDNADRPTQLQPSHGGGQGVAISSGEVWLQQRRFTLSTLRSFGLGKKSFEGQIAEESDMLIKEFEQFEGKPFDNKHLILSAISNVLCAVLFGKRYEYSDPDFRYIIDCLDRQTKLVGSGGAEIFIPLAKYLPKQNHPKADMAKLLHDFTGFLRAIVQDHQKVYNTQNLHDYIDVYLREMQLSRDVTSHLNEPNLLTTLSQLFFAGTDTSATTIRWALMYLMEYSDIQKRLQDDIDAVVGRNRRPKLSDRDDLPYVDAVILETFRIRAPVPLSVPHSTSADTVIKGYSVPKGSMVILNLWGCHHDPKRWHEPEKFNPDRFLDEKGCLTNVEQVIPFSYGRRQCIGEQLAKKEVFIFFTQLLHHFRFEKADDETFDFDGVFGITHSPKSYKMRALVRE